MSYFVVCTFDLKNASHQDYDYKNAYADLERIGLSRVIVYAESKKYVIPTTTAAGQFTGVSATSIRDAVRQKVKDAFTARCFKSELLVVGVVIGLGEPRIHNYDR